MQPLADDEPAVVGPYRLLGRLGSGGMGRVYLGRSAGGRTVAVKIVHPHFALDDEFRARFQREVEAARRVGGAWTAPVLDADPDAPVPWVATAYAAGPSLAAAVADGGPLPAHSVRVLGAGLAEALAAVHDLGLVHRDVKPSNVLLTLDGPLLIDFGIARATDGTASLTSTGVSIGSPGYMSPEQILGKGATGAADVFSLGAVLVHAGTGEPPFPGDSSAALLYKVVHEEPELGSLDGELRELAAACLAKDPAARPTPGEVARRLAPEGTARLVAAGWLPSRLVEQVSRSAVQLLNLEATGTAPDAASGPVGFSRASVPPRSGGGHDSQPSGEVPERGGLFAAGEFGPPPAMPTGPAAAMPMGTPGVGVMPAGPPAAPASPSAAPASPSAAGAPASSPAAVSASPPAATPAPSPAAASAFFSSGVSSAPPSLPQPRDASPHESGAARPAGPGRFSVTVAAGSAPGAGGRGRRVSCSVVLAVAGALAVVTVGSVFVYPLLHQGDSSAGAGSGDYSSAPSASPGATGGKAGGGPATVPAGYLGTWEGQATGLDGTLPMGTFRLTVHQASVGKEVGTLQQTDQLGGVCNDVLTLKQVTKTQLVATSVGAPANHAGCDPAAHTVRLTPVGDDLEYTGESAAEGNPKARLSRTR
ncbi:serine/threonine-protein kinase [Streptomyces sp. Li-HN-5-11]|uniref:serine/threonine-protein kinase n=1 Tax=Streptomyces sp. Li-HN-5-11 TaxID=3075432 RepID=UPI0028B1C7AF|nr:serine/threonine-protein kinase [Streptomyces sp. Li-HN-5-11]WNM29467.1 serine/threonine-protein kinase [Streptomyces sp. Li-HN-5-11]